MASLEPRLSTTIVVNPAAGGGRGAERFERVAGRLLDWCGGNIRLTGGAGEAESIAAEAVRNGVERIVVVGGDGTFNEVVNGLMGSGRQDVVLAHVATGTGCDLARSLGLPAAPAATVAALASSVVQCLDVARMAPVAGPPRYFVNAANVGLGPRIARRVDRWKRLGVSAYAVATAWEVLSGRAVPMRCVRADGVTDVPALNVSICNGPYFGGGMCPEPEASLVSGTLHVVHAGDIGRVEALWLLPRLMRGRLGEHRRLQRFRAGRVEVAGEGAVEADGEIVGYLPATFEVLPGALRVLAPPPGR